MWVHVYEILSEIGVYTLSILVRCITIGIVATQDVGISSFH